MKCPRCNTRMTLKIGTRYCRKGVCLHCASCGSVVEIGWIRVNVVLLTVWIVSSFLEVPLIIQLGRSFTLSAQDEALISVALGLWLTAITLLFLPKLPVWLPTQEADTRK